VRIAEHNTKTPSAKTGFFAALVDLFGGRGSGAPTLAGAMTSSNPSPSRHLVAAAFFAALATAALSLSLAAAPALAAGPPTLQEFEVSCNRNAPCPDEEKLLHATRAKVSAIIHTEGSDTHWHFEYATSKSALENNEGIPAGNGTVVAGSFANTVNTSNGSEYNELRHLTPNTTYYIRLIAENAFGELNQTIEFTTRPVSAPEFLEFKCKSGPGLEGYERLPHDSSGGEKPNMCGASPHQTSVDIYAELDTGGAETTYHFEYSTEEKGAYAPVPGAGGSVTVAEDFAQTKEAHLTGLTPGTTYYLRAVAENGHGSPATELIEFATPPANPQALNVQVRNVTTTSAHPIGDLLPRSAETHWRFEYAPAEPNGQAPPANSPAWLAGTEGVIPAAAAGEGFDHVSGSLSALSPATVYYVRLFAENGHQPASTSDPQSFETAGPPTATTFATHGLHGESLRLLGAVNPHSVPTSEEQAITIEGAPTGGTFTLTFKGKTTKPIAFDASASEGPGSVKSALEAVPSVGGGTTVTGLDGGPYTVYFGGSNAEADQPPLEADPSGLTPSGSVTVTTIQQGGVFDNTQDRFQYVAQQEFGETGWTNAGETPALDAGSGDESKVIGADLPPLQPGETYRYRLLVENGLGKAQGAEQTLAVPTPAAAEPPQPCPNQALRTGPSANLPDCRAYEQLTPTDKEGAQEILHYGAGIAGGALVGEDGEHLMYENQIVNWGAGTHEGQSPYFFTRGPEGRWQMTAAATQPQTGVSRLSPQVYDPNLTRFGFKANAATGSEENASLNVEFATGPPGGPYAAIPVPRKQAGQGWVAASEDFSKLILEVEDHQLLDPEESTGTKSGFDLYEYSAGQLRQVNVDGTSTEPSPIGACGATIAHGLEAGEGERSSRHALSADGSRVFFEAVPGKTCSQPSHLYIRVDGGAEDARTVDLGAARFLAANAQGTEALLERRSGETREVLLADTETATTTALFSTHKEFTPVVVSEDFGAIYFYNTEPLAEAPPTSLESGFDAYLYRYDVPARTLRFVLQVNRPQRPYLSPDGRYAYFDVGDGGSIAGFSAGNGEQAYRYDSAENAVECISCASSFNPAPNLVSKLGSQKHLGRDPREAGTPNVTVASADGSRVFFSTPAALLPADVDGEVAPELKGSREGAEHTSLDGDTSVSSDIYEWRKNGIDGCTRVQGCLALITNGRGGFLNELIGTTASGHDVFFTTASQLVPSDNDTALDIYDARVNGGAPPPAPRPVECEGDACSHPVPAPDDPTPASSSFHGAGNEHPRAPGKKHHHGKRHRKRSHQRAGANHGGKK
jgi:hypothetical protein